jgi:hypothetical protein
MRLARHWNNLFLLIASKPSSVTCLRNSCKVGGR